MSSSKPSEYSMEIRPYTSEPYTDYSAIDEIVAINPDTVRIRHTGKHAAALTIEANGETERFTFGSKATDPAATPELFVTRDDFSDIAGNSPAQFTPPEGHDRGPDQCPAYDEITWHRPYMVHVENLDYGQYIMLVYGAENSYSHAVYAVLLPTEDISAISPTQGQITDAEAGMTKAEGGYSPPECWISLQQNG